MNPITQFISFATLKCGPYKMPLAHERWTRQIEYLKSKGIVENGKIYSEDDLDQQWWNRFGQYVSDHACAYWSWKAYIINKLFEKMQYGDSLCYFDGGCVFPEDKSLLEQLGIKLQKTIECIKNEPYDIALTVSIWVPCGYIVRKEILNKFGISDDKYFLYKYPHWQSGLIVVTKTPKTEKLMHNWIQFYFDNYETCIHFPFNETNGQVKGFIHNGANQAIFQCNLYKGNYNILNVNTLLSHYIKRKRC